MALKSDGDRHGDAARLSQACEGDKPVGTLSGLKRIVEFPYYPSVVGG